MRWLVLVSCILGCAPVPVSTGLFVAQREDSQIRVCEIRLNERWDAQLELCGTPLLSLGWAGVDGGECHVYESNVVSFRDGLGAPYIAVCVKPASSRNQARRKPGPVYVEAVIGLRELP